MKNQELAKLFFDVADVLEMQGVDWKPNAYRKAARALEGLSVPVEKLYADNGIKALMDIPGIGAGIASKIKEFLSAGKVKEFELLLKKIPGGVEEMMHVPGLGPKKVMKLYKKFGIKSLEGLKKTAKQGKLRSLEGFGVKSEQDILRGLGLVEFGKKRRLLGTALPVAQELSARILKVQGVKRAELAGSLRRMNETIGDIDILVISSNPKKVMDFFTAMPEVQAVLAKGSTKSAVILKDGIQADVRVLEEKSFGSAMQYFIGSKEHNIALRQLAIKKGLKLSEYGLFKNNKYICGRTEKEVYSGLGLPFIPYELRENQGEIEAALKHKLPDIVSYDSLLGDLHMHTKWSDGLNTVEEMAGAAEKLGYRYIAITDHSKSERIANGMDEKRLVQYLKELGRIQAKFKIRILKGAEVDILPDGSLDYSNGFLKQLDFVLAAVHSGFKSTEDNMTKRILKAFDNPYVNAFAHPTGRLIFQREPYDFDFEKVVIAAKERGIALEINSYPTRLDLKDSLVKKAVGFGCKLAVDTDSHSSEHLRFAELGIAQARRGWAKSGDVINSWRLQKLEKFLKR